MTQKVCDKPLIISAFNRKPKFSAELGIAKKLLSASVVGDAIDCPTTFALTQCESNAIFSGRQMGRSDYALN